MASSHEHRGQVAKMNAGQDYGAQLDTLGLDPSIVSDILRIIVEEGGLTWRTMTRIIELLWGTPTYDQVYSRIGGTVSVTINDGGRGYTSPPDVSFTGGGGTGTAGIAVLTGEVVTGVTITEYGTGYTSAPQIEFTGGGGRGAAATVSTYTPPFLRPETPFSTRETPTRFTSNETMLDPLVHDPSNPVQGIPEGSPQQLDRERIEREQHRGRKGR